MALEGFFSLSLANKDDKRDTIRYLLGLKAIAKIDAGIAVTMAVTNMVAEAIERFSNEGQKDDYLPKIA